MNCSFCDACSAPASVDLVGIGTLVAACGTLLVSIVQGLVAWRKSDEKGRPYFGYLIGPRTSGLGAPASGTPAQS